MKKIVIIGPESTGKSTLCEQLAKHYGTLWCPEYAREYLLKHGKEYNYEDLLTIARGQIALEDEYISMMNVPDSRLPTPDSQLPTSHSPLATSHSLLFIDTDQYVMKVWCEFVFGKCHRFITGQIKKRKYDLYLLCNTDLPWVKDELREYPDLETRQKLYHIYKDSMNKQPVPWVEISGNSDERMQKATGAVDVLLKF